MISWLQDWLLAQGLTEAGAELLTRLAGILLVLLVALIADQVAKRIVVRGIARLTQKTASVWDDLLLRHGVVHRVAHVAPALVVYHFAVPVLTGYAQLTAVVQQAALIYMIVIAALAVHGTVNVGVEVVQSSRLPRELPVRSLAQVLRLVLYAGTAICVLALVLGRSPLLLLSGLGAMSAVTMLIFKDAILGFVAGIQLSANRMLSRGDWIEMPRHGADGDVLEVGLTTVKVQNWDKTITTIPTAALVTESFKNWRGMSESGGRRIKRAVSIDVSSIRFCDEEMLERFARIQYIAEYLKAKRQEIDSWNAVRGVNSAALADGRHPTNVGTFRAYVVAYLRNHPMVHEDMTFLVRQLAPTEHGLPIEIYVFSSDQEWSRYEAIQADIFDHLLAVVPEFDLRVFQSPSGRDVEQVLDAVADRETKGAKDAAGERALA